MSRGIPELFRRIPLIGSWIREE